jgi:hypothetical protein
MAAPAAAPSKPVTAAGTDRPVLPPDIPQFFLPSASPRPGDARLVYEPRAIGVATVVFSNAKLNLSHARPATRIADMDARLASVEWASGEDVALAVRDLRADPEGDAAYGPMPPAAARPKTYEGWEKTLKVWLAQASQLDLFQSPSTGLLSAPGESERDFRIRLSTAVREQRDADIAKLRQKYAPRFAGLDDRIRRAQQAVAREAEQATQQKIQTGLSIGATVLGALLGRKAVSTATLGRATTAARGMGRTMKEQQDIARARETLAAAEQQKAALEAQVQAEVDALGAARDPLTEPLGPVPVKPKRTDITVQAVGLAWVPFWERADGTRSRA